MSSPTGSDPDYPQGGAPQGGQPGWSASQQPGYGPQGYHAPGHEPSPPYAGGPAATGQRPGTVTAAAIIGIVWGALGALLSLIVMLGAFALGAALIGLLLLLSTALYVGLIIAGAQTLQGRSPRLLLVLSYVAIGLSLVSLVISMVSTDGEVYSGILGIVVPGVIVFLLMQHQTKQHYASRGISY